MHQTDHTRRVHQHNPTMLLRTLIRWVLLALTTSFAAAQETPNLVIIMADDMGFGDVRSYTSATGQAGVNSPVNTVNIDRLATTGMSFTNAHSPSSVCTPTRYGLLTGQYAWRVPVPSDCSQQLSGVVWPFDPPMIPYYRFTMPEMLQSRGYATAAMGKWHLGNDWVTTNGQPAQASGANVDLTQPFRGGAVDHGFDYYFGDDVISHAPFSFIENDRLIATPTYSQTQSLPETTRRAVQYVIGRSVNPQPFFLYLPLGAPHSPIVPPVGGVPADPSIGLSAYSYNSNFDNYENFIRLVDWTVGEVIDALEENGLADNTIIVFTADNGVATEFATSDQISPGFIDGQRIRGRKADGWEGGHRIPLLARWDGHIPAATQSTDLVELTDFYATMLEILEVPTPEYACEDSVSFLPSLLAEPWAEGRRYSVARSQWGSMTVRQVDENGAEWKLIFGSGGGGYLSGGNPMDANVPITQSYDFSRIQLFELSSDPGELTNLVSQGGVSAFELAKAQELQELVLQYMRSGYSPNEVMAETLNFDFGSINELSSNPRWNNVPGPAGGAPFDVSGSSIKSTTATTAYRFDSSAYGSSASHGVSGLTATWGGRYPIIGEGFSGSCIDDALKDGFFTSNGVVPRMSINGLLPGSVWDFNFYGARRDAGGLAQFEVVGESPSSAEIASVFENGGDTALVQGVVVPANGQVDFFMSGDSSSTAIASLNALVMRSRPVGRRYCHSRSNSTGFPARINASGSTSLSHNNLELIVQGVPQGFGLFFHAPMGDLSLFGNGLLCTSGSIVRLEPTFATGGTASLQLDLANAGITAPGPRFFQYWYRDATAGGSFYNTSDGFEIRFVP